MVRRSILASAARVQFPVQARLRKSHISFKTGRPWGSNPQSRDFRSGALPTALGDGGVGGSGALRIITYLGHSCLTGSVLSDRRQLQQVFRRISVFSELSSLKSRGQSKEKELTHMMISHGGHKSTYLPRGTTYTSRITSVFSILDHNGSDLTRVRT